MRAKDRLKQILNLGINVYEGTQLTDSIGFHEPQKNSLQSKSLIAIFPGGGKEYLLSAPFHPAFNTSRRSTSEKKYHKSMLNLLEKEGVDNKVLKRHKKQNFTLQLHILYDSQNKEYQFFLPGTFYLKE